jgi:hypothetical protein
MINLWNVRDTIERAKKSEVLFQSLVAFLFCAMIVVTAWAIEATGI